MEPRAILGMGLIHINFRHSRSLKDKRQFLKPTKDKLKKMGFSVSESGFLDSVQQGLVAYAIVGSNPTRIKELMKKARSLFELSGGEVLRLEEDSMDFAFDD